MEIKREGITVRLFGLKSAIVVVSAASLIALGMVRGCCSFLSSSGPGNGNGD